MNLQDLGALGEFVAAIATLATLVYLAIQIRQNTKSLASQTAQTIMSQAVSTSMDTAANDVLLKILVKLGDGSVLEPHEILQYSIWMEAVMTNYSQIFYEHQHGRLGDDVYFSARRRLTKILAQPGAEEWWKEWRNDFTLEFQDAVERIIGGDA